MAGRKQPTSGFPAKKSSRCLFSVCFLVRNALNSSGGFEAYLSRQTCSDERDAVRRTCQERPAYLARILSELL